MMDYKKLFILFLSFFAFSSGVSAAICDNEHVNQLKQLAEQVEVNYEYIDYSEEINSGADGEYLVNSYSISVNLVSDELYINDGYVDYYYDQTNGGIINFNRNSGEINLIVYSKKCRNIKLRTISLNLPKFNTYSYRSECKELAEYNLDVCDPWYQGTINDSLFNKEVNKYLVEKEVNFGDKIVDFFQKYYLIIGGGLLLVILIIVGIVIHRKRSVLE